MMTPWELNFQLIVYTRAFTEEMLHKVHYLMQKGCRVITTGSLCHGWLILLYCTV